LGLEAPLKVLVTGGLGYLGGRVVEHLRHQESHELRLLVRRVPEDLRSWLRGTELRQGDLTQPETLRGIGDGVEAVVHLAALNEVVCAGDPVAALRVNVEGTLNLLEAAGTDLRTMVYVSTFHVYGANGRGIVTEHTQPAPVHPYAATHLMAEEYVGMYARNKGFNAAIVRLSNGYGAPAHPLVDRWTLLVNNLCREAVEQQRLTLRSSGLQARDFVALEDAAQAIELLLTKSPKHIATYNIGGLATYTVLDVARLVQRTYQELRGVRIPLEHPEPEPGEVAEALDLRCEPVRALGYEPVGQLSKGVRETLEFCLRHFSPVAQRA
jgi:UDP-glucose 4-epimerase